MVGLLLFQTDVWLERQPNGVSCCFGIGPMFVGVRADSRKLPISCLIELKLLFSLTNTC